MTNEQSLAVKAIHELSSLAADFKMGMISNDYIRAQLFNAFGGIGLDVPTVIAETKSAMQNWGEYDDEEDSSCPRCGEDGGTQCGDANCSY